MERFEDWPKRLRDALAAAAATPFEWGRHDCAMLACSLIEAMTGTDPGAAFRSTYESEAGARAIILQHGGSLGTMAAALAEANGLMAVPVRFAQRGDLVLGEAAPLRWAALGIVTGAEAVFPAETAGVRRLPLLRIATAAWRV